MSANKRAYKLYKYSSEDLSKALARIRKGESFGKVAADSKIPKATLFAKFKEKVPLHAKKGPNTVLLESEETRLKKWILDKARLGFPMHADEVLTAVQKVLNEAGRKSIFTDNKPGLKWLKLFLKRHPEIKKKNTEVISKSRASVTEEKLRGWHKEIETYLEEENLTSILERPESIWNGDETGCQLNPKTGRLLGPSKEKNFYEIAAGHEKETITVLCSFSAAGASVPPMVMLPYKRIPVHLTKSIPPDWSIGRSESGWMVSSTFYEYMANVFYPWCVKNNIQFPVIYFLDGHKSHLSFELSNFCREHSIILVALFPNSTHIIQPCDVSIFRALKLKWKEVVQKHKQETQTPLTKANFAPSFKKAFDQLSVESIKNGFRKCGLYPFNANSINYDQCISHRRQQINFTEQTKVVKAPLVYNDFVTTKRFFENYLEEQKLQEFIVLKRNNQNSSDPVYLLWKTCMVNIEFLEAEENQSQVDPSMINFQSKLADAEENSLDCSNNDAFYSSMSHIDVNSALSTANVIEENQLLISSSDDIQVIVDGEINQNDLDILNIPIIDVCDINKLSSLNIKNCSITDSNKSDIIVEKCVPVVNDENICELNVSKKSNELYSVHEFKKNVQECVTIDLNVTKALTENENDSSYESKSMCNDFNVEKVIKKVMNERENGTSPKKNEKSVEHFENKLSLDKSKNTSVDKNISDSSSIWEKHLLWPSTECSKNTKKQEKEKLPYVLTGTKMREYEIKIKTDKEKKEQEKQERLLQRNIKKEENQLKKLKLKEEREIKKEQRVKIKEEQIKIKKEKVEQQMKKKNESTTIKIPKARTNLKSSKKIKTEIASGPLKKIDINIQIDEPMNLCVEK